MPGFFSGATPDVATLLLFFCLFLMVGIAWTVRKLNNVNRQLDNANRQLSDANSKLERGAGGSPWTERGAVAEPDIFLRSAARR